MLFVLALLAAVVPGTAVARWRRIASAPSSDSPYYVCPPRAHGARCTVIQDPTAGTERRGPVRAGAITTGPEQEVSPALSGHGQGGGFSPEELRSVYDLPSEGNGAGQTVAVVDAYDDPHAEADLAVYRREYGIRACTEAEHCFKKVNQEGGSTYPAAEGKWAGEISIDLDMVSAICPECHILLVEAESDQAADLASAEQEAMALGATEISDSYTYTESAAEAAQYSSSYRDPGVPIAAAAGDVGYGAFAPAAYPSVIAVGGTTLAPASRGWSETAWEHTGGGCGTEPKPAWQTDAGCPFRTTNDVAAVADPNTPVSVYDSDEGGNPWRLLGGTSVSTPIVAAAMALSNSYTRSFEGAQALYLESAAGTGFNDVISGLDGTCEVSYLCTAGFGYDGPTGLGGLRGAPDLPTPAPSTEPVSQIATEGATLEGTVDPHGGTVTECAFEYGPTVSYGHRAPCGSLPGPSTTPVPVSATVTGLESATLYHVRLSVAYSGGAGASKVGYLGGSAAGSDLTFTTATEQPAVVTGSASATVSRLTLSGTVDPEGVPVTHCSFEYGATASYGSNVPCSTSSGSGREPVTVSAILTGLPAGRTYHYRLTAAHETSATATGSDASASTLPEPPAVTTGPPTSLTATSAVLHGNIALGEAIVTSCEFEFDSSETHLPCQPDAAQGGSEAVLAVIDGLSPATTYRYRVLAGDIGGTGYGTIEEFTTPAAPLELGGPPPGEAPVEAPRARLLGGTFIVGSSGQIHLPLRCISTSTLCRGVVTLRTLGSVTISRRTRAKRTLTLASSSFTVPAARAGTLTLKLSSAARRLIGRTRRLQVRATVVLHVAPGTSQSTQSTITLSRRPRG